MSFFNRKKNVAPSAENVTPSTTENGWNNMGQSWEERTAEAERVRINTVKHDARIYFYANTGELGPTDEYGHLGNPDESYTARGRFDQRCQDFLSKIKSGEWTHNNDRELVSRFTRPVDNVDGTMNYEGVTGAWQKIMSVSGRDNGAMNNIITSALGGEKTLKMISNDDIATLANIYPNVIDYEDNFESDFLKDMGKGYTEQSDELKKSLYGKQYEYNERLKVHHRWAQVNGRINRSNEGIE